MRLSAADIQKNINNVANRSEYSSDILYELLAAYGRSKSAITQLRDGQLNKAEDNQSALQKNVVYFRTILPDAIVEEAVEQLEQDPLTERYKPRFLIATNLEYMAAKDTKNGNTRTFKLSDIDQHMDFFYAWTGSEKYTPAQESSVDREAAERMNELYAEVAKENHQKFVDNPDFRHQLNIFFTRLLFCFYAEDTEIFSSSQFTGAIKQFTKTDGSDLNWFFSELFVSLNTEDSSGKKPPFDFPYVNGTLFDTNKHAITIPDFNAQARHLILQCGGGDWSDINPDIFGTIFQGVVDPDRRDESGMDYTSVPNILKVIEPLFLDELGELFDKHYDNEKQLWNLLARIRAIKVFDPACGSGNFLIIAYKRLRDLQHAIIARIAELKHWNPDTLKNSISDSQLINIHNFYGIEIDDFARELAVLSMYIAKHQMNQVFKEQFGKDLPIIPLRDMPTIVHGNAARIDWNDVCPNVPHTVSDAEQSALFEMSGEQEKLDLDQKVYDEIYLIGNPPYKGSKLQNKSQKDDFKTYFQDEKYSKDLDYISIWFIKGARYISDTRAELAFVSTSSVCQGAHPSIMLPKIFDERVEIGFAHKGFKWSNSARDQSGVVVIILNLRHKNRNGKRIIDNEQITNASNINGYLIDSSIDVITRRSKPISRDLPKMSFGNMPLDGGNLILNKDDYEKLVYEYPNSSPLFKRLIGAEEFINDRYRYCLWIDSEEKLLTARSIRELNDRIDMVCEFRLSSKDAGTRKKSKAPHQFREMNSSGNTVIVPRVSSERRAYLPIGLLSHNAIVSDSALAIYDGHEYLLSLLMSKLHMTWFRTTGGYLGTSFRYSKDIVYNNFPVQPLTPDQKAALTKSARNILFARENHPEKTLAELYDPDKMPDDLREAHDQNDVLVDGLYKSTAFRSDEERLETLFALYKQMTQNE